jgi:hypothetical protein
MALLKAWLGVRLVFAKGKSVEGAHALLRARVGVSISGGKLGRKGERRFAVSEGRWWAQFVNIQPAQQGQIWLKILSEKIEKYGPRDRLSFVFKSQLTVIRHAYEALVTMNKEEE